MREPVRDGIMTFPDENAMANDSESQVSDLARNHGLWVSLHLPLSATRLSAYRCVASRALPSWFLNQSSPLPLWGLSTSYLVPRNLGS
jgi:hypothetical protein